MKLGLFAVLLALAAINRLALTERLARAVPDVARRHMDISVATEEEEGRSSCSRQAFRRHAPLTHEQPVWPFDGGRAARFLCAGAAQRSDLGAARGRAAVIVAVVGLVWRVNRL